MGFSYTRINNPTVESFEKRVTMLEDGIGSVACASGMAALTNAFLNILQAGDEIVAACGLYGGTVELFDDLKPFGISVKYVSENKPEAFEAEKTRLVFAETIGNPKLDVTDIQAVAEVAQVFGTKFDINGLSFDECLLLLLVCSMIGWVAAWLATVQHLRHFTPE